MTIGTQEILAILFVAAIVGFALYRRLCRKSPSTGECSGCDQDAERDEQEKPIHFFRKQR